MSAAQHTPGPWVHHPDDNIITTPNGFCKLLEWQARSMHVPQEERDANARLIAASPDLLEALQSLIREHDAVFAGREDGAQDSYYNAHPGRAIAYQKARAAIAKATGQGDCA